jgi:hypothetical protein
MDIGSAFTYMFDDPDWIKKLAIGGGIAFGATILSPILIGLVLFLPLSGYMLETLKGVRDGQKLLPEWSDFGSLFMKGLMVALIGFIYSLPSILVSCLSSGLSGGLSAMMAQSDSNNDTAQTALSVVSMCLSCLQIVLSLAASFITPAAIIRYARYDTFGVAFQFSEIFSFISSRIGNYVVAFLLTMVAGLLSVFGLIACIVGVFFTMFWSMLVYGNLFGQLAREA